MAQSFFKCFSQFNVIEQKNEKNTKDATIERERKYSQIILGHRKSFVILVRRRQNN